MITNDNFHTLARLISPASSSLYFNKFIRKQKGMLEFMNDLANVSFHWKEACHDCVFDLAEQVGFTLDWIYKEMGKEKDVKSSYYLFLYDLEAKMHLANVILDAIMEARFNNH